MMISESDRDEDSPPPMETEPPWSTEFVAALHAGCYDDESVTDPAHDPMTALWASVRADPVTAASSTASTRSVPSWHAWGDQAT